MSFEQYFQIPDFHGDEGRIWAVDNIVVVDHNAVSTHPSGVAMISPHVDIYELEGEKIKRVTTYGDNLNVAVLLGQIPAPEIPDLSPVGEVPDAQATGMSPLEANAELIRRWNSHDAALVAEMDQAEATIFAGPLEMVLDRVEMMALNEADFTAFPDVQLDVVRTIDLGQGWVLTELVSRGTHREAFMGVPAAGYAIELRALWLTCFNSQGLITDMSFFYDGITLLTQMTTAEWSPAGTWISAIPTPMGNLILNGVWIPQNAEGTQFMGQYEFGNSLPVLVDLFPDAERGKHAGSLAVRAGRNKYDITFLWQYTKTTGLSQEEIVGYGVVTGTFQLMEEDFIIGQGTGSYYLAAQDADQNGFPDEGEEPIACIPWGWTAERLTMMPGCVPTP
jgi:predicted ester cyclase